MQLVTVLDRVISHWAGVFDNPSINYKRIIIYSAWAQTAFEVWLTRRQLRCYDRPLPPPELKEHLSDGTFRKAQAYGKDKARYSLVKTIFDQVVSWAMIQFDWYPKSWEMAGRVMGAVGISSSRMISRSLFWTPVLLLPSIALGLPWSWYYTFVLEEKHGFNKSTLRLWVTDQVKSFALIAVIGLPILAGFLSVIGWAGKSFVPWLMVFMIGIQLSLQIIYPTFIQPLFNKLAPLPTGELRGRVESLSGKLGFPLKHLYVIDGSKRSSHSNAYFYGLPWSKHIVIYDTLIEKSSAAEVEAVLGHELGHWYLSHPTKLLVIAQAHLFFILGLFSVFIHNQSLYRSFGFSPSLAHASPGRDKGQPIMIGFSLFQMLLDPTDTVLKFLLNALTRKYEYQADEFAIRLDKKDDLKASLIKLHIDNLSSPHNDPLYSMYHHSHPTLPERLTAMDRYTGGQPLPLKDTETPVGSKKDL